MKSHPRIFHEYLNDGRLFENSWYLFVDGSLFLLSAGNKVAAVKRVAELTGAGLRLSKDYLDALVNQVVT